MTKNIVYKTAHLADYFLTHRRRWDEFYSSERWIFERVGARPCGFGKILDVGCAVGGLGKALSEKFPITSYTGIDINAQAIDVACANVELCVPTKFICADIVTSDVVADGAFDTVASLSVADWNINTDAIIAACWKKVAPGGRMIISLRLSDGEGTRDFEKSYQYIVPNEGFELPQNRANLEKAPYVVLNIREAFGLFVGLDPAPSDILAYGYGGVPSATATTPYDRLTFAVLAIMRPADGECVGEPRLECHLPATVLL